MLLYKETISTIYSFYCRGFMVSDKLSFGRIQIALLPIVGAFGAPAKVFFKGEP